ncbi:MAG TPA: hypothetical protein VKE94_12245, partial [Gemmataceae bacterium]|nr:hypothetical protein [Gemmataceae bacterium]
MNDEATFESESHRYTKYYVCAGIAGAIVFVLYLVFGGSGASVATNKSGNAGEDQLKATKDLQAAREGLNKAADLNTCRAALGKINQVLARQPAGADFRLPTEQAELLRKRFELKDDEWAEVSNDTFTLLDGPYLETTLLFRDAAASYTPDGVLTSDQPMQRANAAFAWAVCQVRLIEAREDANPLPVDYVLRRGFGTPLERGLVFLELLRQFEVSGCLLAVQEPGPTGFPLWACGALVGRDIYLYDPRMGIPLPGPNGKGVATLADAQKNPEVLKQLSVDGADRYDVTAELAGNACIYLALPLSALAPRMRYLEKELRDPDVPAPVVPGHFGADAVRTIQLFEDVLTVAGSKERLVRAWPTATRSLRETLPTIEGGLDKSTPPMRSQMRNALVPRRAFPATTPDGRRWDDMGVLYGMMLQRFSKPFIDLNFDPQQPRELLLRGRLSEALRPLTTKRAETAEQRARYEKNAEMPAQVRKALEMVIPALAELQKAEKQAGGDPRNPAVVEATERWEGVWKLAQVWLDALVDGAAAGPLGQEVNYLLA